MTHMALKLKGAISYVQEFLWAPLCLGVSLQPADQLLTLAAFSKSKTRLHGFRVFAVTLEKHSSPAGLVEWDKLDGASLPVLKSAGELSVLGCCFR